MDISLDAFSSPGFDAKGWVNKQFAALSVDEAVGAGPEGLAQRLATQLHFLAANAQQNSDRIKARFRHQAAQIARDIASLSRLVQDTQQQMAGVAAAVAAQRASAPAMQALADVGAVKRRVEDSVSALDYLRNYTDLPQKIGALIAQGELARAWELVDAAGPAARPDTGALGALSAEEAQRYRQQIQGAVVASLGSACEADNVDAAAQASRLLAEHGCSEVVAAEILRVCAERGARRLRKAMDAQIPGGEGSDDVRAILDAVLSLVAADRALVEAVDAPHPDALLEELLSRHTESILPSIQRAVAHAQHGNGAHLVLDLYQTLAGYYGELLNAVSTSTLSVGDNSGAAGKLAESPVPRSLRLLFGPLAGYIGGLAELEADQIRQGSLRDLLAIEADSGRVEPFVRDASRAIVRVFADIEQALDRVFAVVPPSRVADAVSGLAAPALAVHSYLHDTLADASRAVGVSFADLTGFSRFDNLQSATAFAGAAYQPLTSESKLRAVSSCIGLTLLGHVFEQCAAETAASVGRRWTALVESLAQSGLGPTCDSGPLTTAEPAKALLIAFMDARSTAAEMGMAVTRLATGPPPNGARKIEEAAARLARQVASAVLFLLTGAFRPPLSRIPASEAWHAVRESKSSMDIVVPQFSCSPSEEAVDIGEKMHILLPELEQVEMMHAQYARGIGAPAGIPPLYIRVLESLADSGHPSAPPDSPAPSPMLEMLSLVLRTVQQGFVNQVCQTRPPMSSHGRQQMAADVEYIASVASSFVGSAAPEFEALHRLVDDRGDDGKTVQLLDLTTQDKLCALFPATPH
ncbi:hypothetical protein H4R19_000870 [Coemansia spiralis]|nr:hypothetical protein H4R19_000870 [Coemansia spiralis]